MQNLLSFFQKTCLPKLQFLSQKSLQHSHFLCIVMCAVLYKSKFSNSATHKFSFKFFLHYCKTFYHFFKKHGCLNYSFCRQNNCNTPIFLCVVATCAVFCKRRFPNKFTCKMSLTFSNSISYWRNNTTVFAVYNFCNEGKLQMRKKQRKPLLNFSLQTSFVVLQYFYNRKKTAGNAPVLKMYKILHGHAFLWGNGVKFVGSPATVSLKRGQVRMPDRM